MRAKLQISNSNANSQEVKVLFKSQQFVCSNFIFMIYVRTIVIVISGFYCCNCVLFFSLLLSFTNALAPLILRLLTIYAVFGAYLKTTAELAANGIALVGTVTVLSLCDVLASSILVNCSGKLVTFLKLTMTAALVGL